MELNSNSQNIIDSFFKNIWQVFKRKRTYPQEDSFEITSNDNVNRPKKVKTLIIEDNCSQTDNIASFSYLENVLKSLLCSVCHEFCQEALQCLNGHLLCSYCSFRLTDQKITTCPVCRVSLLSNLARSLVTEHLVSDIPEKCSMCSDFIPKCLMRTHKLHNCNERKVFCKFKIFGCEWNDSIKNVNQHEVNCNIMNKSAVECYLKVQAFLDSRISEERRYGSNFNSILKQLKHTSHNFLIKNLRFYLRFIEKEMIHNGGITLMFGNNNFKENFKSKLRIIYIKDNVEIQYCIQGNKSILGKYSIFLTAIKTNYITFDVYDKLQNIVFSNHEEWSNWFTVTLNDPFMELINSNISLEGRYIDLEIFFMTINSDGKKCDNILNHSSRNDRWTDLIDHIRYINPIESQQTATSHSNSFNNIFNQPMHEDFNERNSDINLENINHFETLENPAFIINSINGNGLSLEVEATDAILDQICHVEV